MQLAVLVMHERGIRYGATPPLIAIAARQPESAFDVQAVERAHLFGAAAPAGDDTVVSAADVSYQVQGLLSYNDDTHGMAILKESGTGISRLYQLGATLSGDARLYEVKTDRIVIRRGEGLQALLMPHLGSGRTSADVQFAMAGTDAAAVAYDLSVEPESAHEKTVEPPEAGG